MLKLPQDFRMLHGNPQESASRDGQNLIRGINATDFARLDLSHALKYFFHLALDLLDPSVADIGRQVAFQSAGLTFL